MRILWVAHFAGIDGANLTLAEAVEALAARGHASAVVLPRQGPIAERIDATAEVSVVHHNQWVTTKRLGPARAARWMAYNRRVAAPQLARIAREFAADVVVGDTFGVVAGALAARRAGVPHVWFLHELIAPEFGYRFLLGRRLTMALARRWTHGAVGVSESVRRRFADALHVEVSRVHPWVRLPPTAQSHPSADWSARPLRLVSVGSWIPGKRQRDAIDAVAIASRRGVDVRLDLVGGCEDRSGADLARRASEADVADRIRLIPFPGDPFPHYAAAHAAVMCAPSEGLGRGAIEPLKLGRPVIAPSAGGLAEVVEDRETGLHYRPADPADLAARIEELDADRALLRRLGERGRDAARAAFTREGMAAGLVAALDRAAAGAG